MSGWILVANSSSGFPSAPFVPNAPFVETIGRCRTAHVPAAAFASKVIVAVIRTLIKWGLLITYITMRLIMIIMDFATGYTSKSHNPNCKTEN